MKKLHLTLEDLFDIPSAQIYNPDSLGKIFSVSIDTRTIKKNSLFIAIKGKNFDGHTFIKEAIDKGASAVLVNNNYLKHLDDIDIPIITVNNTLKALGFIASTWRNKLQAKVIALTGSNGKTTTKEIVVKLLSNKYKVTATIGNNNNDIGVPLTILSADENTEMLVLELGTNHFGEIEYTSEIAKPDLALITNIGESHLEFLNNKEGVLKEKEAIFRAAKKNNGKVLINSSDSLLFSLRKNYEGCILFGFKGKASIKGNTLKIDEKGRPTLEIKYNDNSILLDSPLFGKSNSQNLLAATAIALTLGMSADEIIDSVGLLKPVKQRLEVFDYKNIYIIDDTYNANPVSLKASLNIMSTIKVNKRKVVVLGDMFELGESANLLHKEIAKDVLKSGVKEVLLLGKLMKNLYTELNAVLAKSTQKSNINVLKFFPTREKLSNYLLKNDFERTTVLFKGSRGMKMEEFSTILKDRYGK